jgi:hypothetical protein
VYSWTKDNPNPMSGLIRVRITILNNAFERQELFRAFVSAIRMIVDVHVSVMHA